MSPQLENEKRIAPMTVELAMRHIRCLGEYGLANFVSFGVGYMKIDGSYSAEDLRRIADLWDACHDEEGNER